MFSVLNSKKRLLFTGNYTCVLYISRNFSCKTITMVIMRTLNSTSIRLFFCLLLLVNLFSLQLTAQTKPQAFVLGSYEAATTTIPAVNGYGGVYPTGSVYNLNYGMASASQAGFNRIIKTFNVEGQTYTLTKAVPGSMPFQKVIVNRYGASPEQKVTALFEVQSTPPKPTNSEIYLTPDYVGNMEDLINSYVINRGTDNVFVRNTTSATSNNITRIDLILATPVVIPANEEDRKKSGFLLMERGGNDSFRAAAILSASDPAAVTDFGNVVQVAGSNWGGTGQSITSVVMQKNESDANLRISQDIPSQQISGVFISLNDLGPAGTTVYGISVIENNATDPVTFGPTSAEGVNGLDFMAGGGFFTKAILVKGNVWIDDNEDAIRTEGGTNNGGSLWANLVGPDGKVISSIDVKADGTYTLFVAESVRVPGNYKVILTNSEKREGDDLSASDPLLNSYYHTGTNFTNTPNTTNTTGVIDIGTLFGIDEDVEGIDFGIKQQIPTPVNLIYFNGKQSENEVLLEWSTSSETGNSGFEVEHSEDGKTWHKVGFVESKAPEGNSEAEIFYAFTHTRPLFGHNYYRLRQIDIDGTVDESAMIHVKVSIGSLIVWPNPSPGTFKVAVSPEQSGQISTMQVVDMSGRTLRVSNSFRENWDISDLRSDAFYILKVVYKNNFSEQVRIYKK